MAAEGRKKNAQVNQKQRSTQTESRIIAQYHTVVLVTQQSGTFSDFSSADGVRADIGEAA